MRLMCSFISRKYVDDEYSENFSECAVAGASTQLRCVSLGFTNLVTISESNPSNYRWRSVMALLNTIKLANYTQRYVGVLAMAAEFIIASAALTNFEVVLHRSEDKTLTP